MVAGSSVGGASFMQFCVVARSSSRCCSGSDDELDGENDGLLGEESKSDGRHSEDGRVHVENGAADGFATAETSSAAALEQRSCGQEEATNRRLAASTSLPDCLRQLASCDSHTARIHASHSDIPHSHCVVCANRYRVRDSLTM